MLSSAGVWAPKIALIDVDGVLSNASASGILGDGEHPVSLLLEKLDRARKDPDVKAVILRINSPGGTVAASELMFREVEHFRRATGKPVAAVMMDVAASGGYYLACACDPIVAHESTVTGSIGVVMLLFDVTGTLSKIGVKPTTIKSGESKAAGSPFEQLSERDRQIFQGIIDQMYDGFLKVVRAGRPKLSEDQIRALADGRVYTARQALEAGLIDRIGTLRDTVAGLKEQLGLKRASLVAYRRPLGYVPNYYARAPSWGGDINVFRLDLPEWAKRVGPQFLYLWAP